MKISGTIKYFIREKKTCLISFVIDVKGMHPVSLSGILAQVLCKLCRCQQGKVALDTQPNTSQITLSNKWGIVLDPHLISNVKSVS